MGIILVVFGHTFPLYSITSYVYAFHMPLFFVLSGYTFNTQKYLKAPLHFFKKKIIRLLVPYFIAAIFSYVLYLYLAPTLSFPEITASAAALGILSGNGNNLQFNNVLWFLPAYFLAGLVFLVLRLLFRGTKLLINIFLFSSIGIIIGLFYPLPFGLDIALTTQLFIYCGYTFRKANWFEKIKKSLTKGFLLSTALAAMLVMFVLSTFNGRTDLMSRVYGQPVLFFIAGLSGSVSVLLISLFFSIVGQQTSLFGKLQTTIAKASMYIFVSHIPISYCLASVCVLLWGFWVYYSFETYWYIFFSIGLSVPTLIYFLVTTIISKKWKKIP